MLRTKLVQMALKGIDGNDTELFDYTPRMEDIYMWGLKNMPAKVMQNYINQWEKEDERDDT